MKKITEIRLGTNAFDEKQEIFRPVKERHTGHPLLLVAPTIFLEMMGVLFRLPVVLFRFPVSVDT